MCTVLYRKTIFIVAQPALQKKKISTVVKHFEINIFVVYWAFDL